MERVRFHLGTALLGTSTTVHIVTIVHVPFAAAAPCTELRSPVLHLTGKTAVITFKELDKLKFPLIIIDTRH